MPPFPRHAQPQGMTLSNALSNSSTPTVDLATDSQDVVQQTISNAAISTGFVFIRNLPMQIDFFAVQRLFDELYQNLVLATRLNSINPLGRAFKLGGKWTGDLVVDDKATIDLPARETAYGEALRRNLSVDFETAVNFFQAVEDQLVPLVLQATSDALPNRADDLWNSHRQRINNFRLIDYHRSSGVHRQGCREHRDPGTATIIFQDGSGGLEIQDPLSGVWRSVPGDETVVM